MLWIRVSMNKKNTKLKNNPSKIMTTIQFIELHFGQGKNEDEKKFIILVLKRLV